MLFAYIAVATVASALWTWFLLRSRPDNQAFNRLADAAKANGQVADEIVRLLKQRESAFQAERWTLISSILGMKGVKLKAAPAIPAPAADELTGPILTHKQDLARFNGNEQRPETHIDPSEV